MTGIVSCGAYVPLHRLDRAAARIGRGTRSVASFDEDSTSLAVEAARRALAGGAPQPSSITFTTTAPAYADRTNASAIHLALGLPPTVGAFDAVGSVRSTMGALRAAWDAAAAGRASMVVAGDVRVGLPGAADERDGGDAGAAVVIAPEGPALAELTGWSSITAEFLDRWRVPGEATSRTWEERFGETVYLPLARAALDDALKSAGLVAGDVDHLIVTGLHGRAVAGARKAAGVRPEAVVDDLSAVVGVTGAAHPLLLLGAVLEQARPGANIVLLVLADGADCLVLQAGELAGRPSASGLAAQLEGRPVAYHDMLVWRGLLRREPPRRPDPDRPAAPPAVRTAAWKFGFVGSRCRQCGTRHLPPERVCLRCQAVDDMEAESLADLQGTVATFAVDHLAFSVAPPVVMAVVDFDGGGRLQCELTDVDPASVAVGDRVELTFRRIYTTTDGVHDYFWKAKPVAATSKEA